METIFLNQFICTKDYYKEYYEYIYFKKPVMVIITIILSINFIISLLSIVFPKWNLLDTITAEVNIATVLIVLCIQIYTFFRNKNLAYNRSLEGNQGKPIEVKLFITEKGISIYADSEKDKNIDFTNIEKTIQTKNYYILITKAKLAIALKKDGFHKGTAKEFKEFLKQKNLIRK